MGNCICVTGAKTRTLPSEKLCSKRRKRSSTTVLHDYYDDGEKLLGENNNVTSSSSSSSCVGREIKIRMTKKELENLMQNISVKGLTAEEVLSKLLSDGANQIGFAAEVSDHHRPWKPALHSIPELD